MNGADPAGVRFRSPNAIDFVLEPDSRGSIGFRIWSGVARRRHCAPAQLDDDALPKLGVGAGIRDVQIVERHPGGVQLLIVASEAIFLEDGPRRGSAGGNRRVL